MDIDLLTLRLFVAVAEELNMTRAARREHLVLPAASKRLKDLEDRAGAKLLYRHARGVTLTPAGLSLLLPSLYVAPNLKPMKLAAIALDEPWADRKLALAVRDLTSLPVLARKLVEHLSRKRALTAR
jgi:DNA-binding transcriptional LysR family regulator